MPFIGNKPAQVPLTSADITDSIITSAKITDATIVNGDIANSTISLAKLSATGTKDSTTFLRGDNSFAAVSSDYVLLATTDITSSTASVSFDGYFSSTYRNYKIIFSNVVPVSTAQLYARFRVSDSDVTSNYYAMAPMGYRNDNGSDSGNFTNNTWNTGFIYVNSGNTISNNSSYGLAGELTIVNPSSTATYKSYYGNCGFFFDSSLTYIYGGNLGGQNTNSTSALSGFKFYFSTGNISSGNFKLYGLK
jgi:hypothetical protein